MGALGALLPHLPFSRASTHRLIFVLQEEHPPIISNVGMGSTIVNYYRKKAADDPYIPNVRFPVTLLSSHSLTSLLQLEIGQPVLLEGTDESPFKIFGFVHPGQTVTTLYNNLIRAPMFKHDVPETDFLVVRYVVLSTSSRCSSLTVLLAASRSTATLSTSFARSLTCTSSVRPIRRSRYPVLIRARSPRFRRTAS